MNPLDLKTFFMFVPHGTKTMSEISSNPFLPKAFQVYVLNAYQKAMQKFVVFRRFIHYGLRKKRKSVCTEDLSLTPLSSFPKSVLYDLFDRGVKYTFRTSDLLSLIHSSLTRSNEFICDPVPVKNPFTGEVFSKETLYRFYVHVNLSTFAVPILFALYVSCDFDLRPFLLKNEPILRDVVIHSVVTNFTLETKIVEVRVMLENITMYDIVTDHHTPIVNFMRLSPAAVRSFIPLLHHYFIHLYSLNPYYRQASHSTVVKALLAYKET
jgi:hypothetical protein